MRSVLTELTLGHPAFQFNTCAAPNKTEHSLTAKRGNLGYNTQSGTGGREQRQASFSPASRHEVSVLTELTL